jgi:hypothetical protein
MPCLLSHIRTRVLFYQSYHWIEPPQLFKSPMPQGLLTRDPSRRLGYGGASEVKNHPFFLHKGFKWQDVFNRSVSPPFELGRITNPKSDTQTPKPCLLSPLSLSTFLLSPLHPLSLSISLIRKKGKQERRETWKAWRECTNVTRTLHLSCRLSSRLCSLPNHRHSSRALNGCRPITVLQSRQPPAPRHLPGSLFCDWCLTHSLHLGDCGLGFCFMGQVSLLQGPGFRVWWQCE